MTLPVVFTANGPSGYNLTNSLRFRSSASAYLSRTFGTPTDPLKWTWSSWVKRSNLGSNGTLIAGVTSGSIYSELRFVSTDILRFHQENGATTVSQIDTVAVFRDPSAWYHVVCVYDSANATTANRLLIYINGVLQTTTAVVAVPSSQASNINKASEPSQIGNLTVGPLPFDGYMTEINFVDGQALTPSSFGQTSATTGVWIPKKYTGTYGTNGFYLPFTDNSALTTSSNVGLGKDFSGNANYWTTNNISITSGSTYDSMTDVPTLTSATAANYCTLNAALQAGGYTLNDGNLNWARTGATGGGSDRSQFGTIGVTSGKWYWEFTAGTTNANSLPAFGIAIGSASTQSWAGSQTGAYIYNSDGTKNISGTNSAYGASFTTGDIIGVVFDADAGTLTFYKNNTSQGTAASGLTSGPYFPAVTRSVGGGGSNGTEIANFGQRPFAYTPPTGFVALNTFNLPTPTIGATASSQANKYFNAITYTGNGAASSNTTQNITTTFYPDLTWVKGRDSSFYHRLTSTGLTQPNYLSTNSTDAEGSVNDTISALASTYFQVKAAGTGGTNQSGSTYVGWTWNANSGSTVSNTAGSITSTVSANTTAGFSIVTYTGNNTSGATVGHGLGVVPAMVICKNRSAGIGSGAWPVWHKSLTGGSYYLFLNTTAAQSNANNNFTATPSSTVLNLGTSDTNNTATMVAYCFAEIAGYSAFGSYTGNGSTDGPFVYLGFRPRFVMWKNSSAAEAWLIEDTARSTYNEVALELYPSSSGAEAAGSSRSPTQQFDYLSNGFKVRGAQSQTNGSGNTIIYMAFAESPFKYANAR